MLKRLFLAVAVIAIAAQSLIAGPVRGRALTIPFQIVQISDGSDVTSGTVVVKVSKDGGAQATATNSASHLGGGQWVVTLTAAEMDAASVGVQITESGSYTTNQTIVTWPYENRVWYVDDGGNDSNDGRTWATAKLTPSAAQTAALQGDVICVGPGTYSGAQTFSKDGITWQGVDAATCIFTHNSGDTLTVTGDNVTLDGLTFTASAATSNGTGGTATSVKNLTIRRCVFNGHFDGLRLITCDQLIIDRTVANGTFDGLNPSGCTGTISNSTFTTDGSWGTDTQFRAVYINDVQASLDDMITNLTFDTCRMIARKAGVGASNTEIVGIVATGTVTLKGCMVIAEATNASNAGGVWAVRGDGKLVIQYTYPGRLTINGGMLYAVTAGTGSVYKIINSNANSECRVVGLAYAASDVSGKVYNDTAQGIAANGINAASFAAGTLADEDDVAEATRIEMDANSTKLAAVLADTNELQVDWVNGGRLDLLIDGVKAKTDLVVAAPANWSSLGINGSGHLSRVTLADTLSGMAGTIQNLDQLDTDQDLQHGVTQGTLNLTAANAASAASSSLAVQGKLPSGSARMAGEGNTVKNLDQVAVEGGTGLTAEETRAALGMSSANLDAQLAALPTAAENVTALLETTLTDSGAGKAGRSLYYLLNSFAASGKATEDFFDNQPAAAAELTPEQIEDLVDGLVEAGAVPSPISPLDVNETRKWKPDAIDSSKAGNFVTVNRGFSKTLAAVMPLNPGADIDAVTSVTITGPAAVTATNLRKAADGTEAHLDLTAPITTPGNYTFLIEATTFDDQEISMLCRLVVK